LIFRSGLIISFEVANLIDKTIFEYAPYPNYGGIPEAWSPHYWIIHLIMAEGTDVTRLAPIITLAPGATITSRHTGVQDFSRQVDYTVLSEDGSTVYYSFLAHVQDNTREQGWININHSTGGTTSCYSQYYHDSIPFKCQAIPDMPYSFKRWWVNNSPTNNTNVRFDDYIPMDWSKNAYLKAEFEPVQVYYTVYVASNNSWYGSVSPSGSQSVLAFQGLPVKATPASSDYGFKEWQDNGGKVSDKPSFTFYPIGYSTLTAIFVKQYTVTVQADPSNKGRVEGGGTFLDDTYISVSAWPYNGFAFDGWYDPYGGVVTRNATYYFTVNSDRTLIAKFVDEYTVTVKSEDVSKGEVSPSVAYVPAGRSVQVKATPKSGYALDGWYLNGTKKSGSEIYDFYPDATCTLTAKFNQLPSLVISGPTAICSGSTGSFSASDWQSGFTWSVYGNASITGSNSNSSVSVKANNKGTESATIYVYSGSTVIESKTVNLQSSPDIYADPNYNCQKIDGSQYVGSYGFWWVPSIYGTGPFYYRWYVEDASASNYKLTYSGPHASIDFGGQMSCTLWVEVSNSCGTDYASIQIYASGRGGSSSAYPNPVSDILHVIIGQQTIANAKTLNPNPTFDVRLYNAQGNLLRNTTSKGENVEFNVSNLPNGIYYLHIDDGSSNRPEIQQIVVRH